MVAAVLCAGLLALTGCGGGEEEQGKPPRPHPAEPISSLVAPFNAALDRGNCEAAARLTFSTLREVEEPGAAPTEEECEFLEAPLTSLLPPISFLQLLAEIRFEKSEQYGSAALMEGEAPDGERVAAVWALDVDGHYRYVGAASTDKPQIGHPQPRGNNTDVVAAVFVRSVGEGKCNPDLLNPIGTLAEEDVEAGCLAAEEDERFVSAIRESPEAGLLGVGRTPSWAFFELSTDKGVYTVILGSMALAFGNDPPEDFGIYDVLPTSP